MESERKRVGLLFGGVSTEHEVSLVSAKSIFEALNKEIYEPVLIKISKVGGFFLAGEGAFSSEKTGEPLFLSFEKNKSLFHFEDGRPLERLDVIFPVLHGPMGEDGTMQGLLTLAQLPFVGCSVLSSAVCMDKDFTKKLLTLAGLPLAKSLTFYSYEKNAAIYDSLKKELGLPLFVKPATLGSSVAVSKVESEEAFTKALEEAFSYSEKVLVEEFVEGRELEVALLGEGADVKASPVGEVVTDHDFYSYEAKYIKTDFLKIGPAENLPEGVSDKMRELAVKAFRALDCSGLSRCDFFLKKNGELIINEVNPIPGFTPMSLYPVLWGKAGVSFSKLVQRLLELAIEKHKEMSQLKTSCE